MLRSAFELESLQEGKENPYWSTEFISFLSFSFIVCFKSTIMQYDCSSCWHSKWHHKAMPSVFLAGVVAFCPACLLYLSLSPSAYNFLVFPLYGLDFLFAGALPTIICYNGYYVSTCACLYIRISTSKELLWTGTNPLKCYCYQAIQRRHGTVGWHFLIYAHSQ